MGCGGASTRKDSTGGSASSGTRCILAATGRCPHAGCTSAKADGKQRPLGIAALEDITVQQAVVTVLTPIHEANFLGFSYGFRPRRNQHQALDAVVVGMQAKRVNWVLDADIKAFLEH